MNVANVKVLPITKSIFQWAGSHRYGPASELEIGNIGTGNIYTLATLKGRCWDGWNIIREIQWPVASGQWPVVTDNVWGLDLDGTLQGAGGVGGLLAVIRSGCAATNLQLTTYNSQLYFPTYDANGNISEYVSTNGEIVAHYDYSPFGETLMQTGDLASTFTPRFSTKPWCPVTGLCEYQMRKYKPEIGRWLSRDPMEEKFEFILYGFVMNNPIQRKDYLGTVTLSGFLDSRLADFLVCMGECIEDNDPLEKLAEKIALSLVGATLPKTAIAKLARMTGDAKFADKILASLRKPGIKPITTVPSVLAHYLGIGANMKHMLRLVGDVGSGLWLAYGSYMVAVEAACLGHCCASRNYDYDTGIDIFGLDEILDLGTALWNTLLGKLSEGGEVDDDKKIVY
jgi:RHS repeat-associated protein